MKNKSNKYYNIISKKIPLLLDIFYSCNITIAKNYVIKLKSEVS